MPTLDYRQFPKIFPHYLNCGITQYTMNAEFPSGTVTLLFTDIEGSTRLLQQLGEKYTTLLAQQRQILREACEMHNGRVMDSQGDSLFVAFPRAIDAIKAVVQSQRTLAAQTWINRYTVP